MDQLRLCFLLALTFVTVIANQAAPVHPATDTTLSDVTTQVTTGPNTPTSVITEATTVPTTETTTAQPTKEPTTLPPVDSTTTQHVTTEVPTTSSTEPPKPKAGTWNVTNSNNTLCLKLTMSAQFTYHDTTEKTVSLPESATVDESKSSCNQDKNLLVLTWDHYIVTFDFGKDNTHNKTYYKLSNLTFEDGKTKSYLVSRKFLAADVGSSYKCNYGEFVAMTAGLVNWKHVQVQAFMDESHSTNFGSEQLCINDDIIFSIVPIAVECALIAQVIIVLIVYFVGRRIIRQNDE